MPCIDTSHETSMTARTRLAIADLTYPADAGSDREVTSRSHTPPAEESTLEAAITDLSEDRKTKLLLDIVRNIEDAEAFASTRLLTPISTGGTAKRKVFEKCTTCGLEYAVAKNPDDACKYHSVRLLPDERTVQ